MWQSLKDVINIGLIVGEVVNENLTWESLIGGNVIGGNINANLMTWKPLIGGSAQGPKAVSSQGENPPKVNCVPPNIILSVKDYVGDSGGDGGDHNDDYGEDTDNDDNGNDLLHSIRRISTEKITVDDRKSHLNFKM